MGHPAVEMRQGNWTVSLPDERASPAWVASYLRTIVAADGICAFAAGLLALVGRFSHWASLPREYLIFTAILPVLWWTSVALARGYDARLIGTGPDEFRKIVNAAVIRHAQCFGHIHGWPARQAGTVRKDHLVRDRLYRSIDIAPAIIRMMPRMVSTIPSGGRWEAGDDKCGKLGGADSEGKAEGVGDADGDRECDGLGEGRPAQAAESTSI